MPNASLILTQTIVSKEEPPEKPDGQRDTFSTLKEYVPGSLLVFLDGILKDVEIEELPGFKSFRFVTDQDKPNHMHSLPQCNENIRVSYLVC